MTLAGPARVSAFIGLGANLGDTARTLTLALEALAALPDTELLAVSSLYRSAPVDASGPDYLNAAARLETALPPEELLRRLQAIELAHGRERPFVNASRTLDLDLLLYADEQIRSEHLCVPHPRLHQRAFVLLPLLEIAPDLTAPGLGVLQPHLAAVSGQRVERLPGD
ncbi:2-amino-4-hydroxy-6-hydroxymethyldihydropteridine diphosphokinase [Paucibacter sp. M5-1]|uniref:2-amino-4-hydroxy-6- hydroxymethyldihydropteridine diphosphokinase n=1 Tax=Paucibacter sp. M5-1 TaxID=3015998 RepID=UPI0022B88F0E|nr:2-amino-4-hydroxy-6-hydroxymethyldihydropteridine diphosphokinase [Paucibacter sp. M5-1]MCZ7883649.1 2-amino-4-hydroxy-6-hydroxymethyldihydropteridine diphosphokinase [Paucibacter sp. M5-1]